MKKIIMLQLLCLFPLSLVIAQDQILNASPNNEMPVFIEDSPPLVEDAPAPAMEPGLWKIKLTTGESDNTGSSKGMREMSICYTADRIASELNNQLTPASDSSLLPNAKCKDIYGPVVTGQRVQRTAECLSNDGTVKTIIKNDCTYRGKSLICESGMSAPTENLKTLVEGTRLGECS